MRYTARCALIVIGLAGALQVSTAQPPPVPAYQMVIAGNRRVRQHPAIIR